MLRKLAAVLVLVGLCLPFGCDVRPIIGVWDSAASAVMLGIPVVAAVLYVLQELLPPLAAAMERGGPALHGALRTVFLLLAGAYLLSAIQDGADPRDRLGVAAALVVTGSVLVWHQGRGTKAQRVPLLLLGILGLAAVDMLVRLELDLQPGGWVLTGGWALAVIEESRLLRAMSPIVHGE